jgi:CubicO group peptidase (beta-lactamase class C family)
MVPKKFVALALLHWALATSALAQSENIETVLNDRVRQYAHAVSSGDPQVMKQFVNTSLGEQLQRIPMANHIGLMMSMWDKTRGLTLVELQKTDGPNETVALFKNELTGEWYGMWFKLEPAPPYRIVAIGPRPARLPPAVARKYTERQIASELDRFVKKLTDAGVFSGVVAVAKDGKVVFQRAYGYVDRNFDVPARLDAKYQLASMGKMFTAVAIAQLQERGSLSYEDPLSKFVPDFPNEEASRKILIKHLLSHTAGLGMWWGPRWSERTAKDTFSTVDSMLEWAKRDESTLLFEPGTRYAYSNTGYVVLGKVIEQVTGQSYHEYVRRNILEPAGMANTCGCDPQLAGQSLAVGYNKIFNEQGKAEFRSNPVFPVGSGAGPHGGGFSTAGDMLRFGRALRAGQLLRPENVALLLTPKREIGSDKYGYGFDVNEADQIAGHGGGTMGVSNNIDMFTDSGWSAIVMSNLTLFGYEPSAPVVAKIRELVRNAR